MRISDRSSDLCSSDLQQFQPNENINTSQVNIKLVPGTTIEQTAAVAGQVTGLVEKQPEVERVLAASREAKATLYISLKPATDRDTTSKEFEQRLAPQFQKIPDARVSFASQAAGFGTGRATSVILSGSAPARLNPTPQPPPP